MEAYGEGADKTRYDSLATECRPERFAASSTGFRNG